MIYEFVLCAVCGCNTAHYRERSEDSGICMRCHPSGEVRGIRYADEYNVERGVAKDTHK